ncbi:SMP-30/gluconolactonase/LRE family protein [Mycobacterium sp. KBS0706]|uniref:SMP-30/gluconolactonase/LRE family protein n=1 Tax=Mycobacterium sp. KBS0706 TaxID=2578109 RepID=UPI00110FBE17|nr:SMP-30/gluconolactonase/LRE family protein [Mycobacterium sp. KBS0706]TSD86134.1 SMP-30/gluconolactonase/LRE family protein [Mycobacterium sp. KBS0706]
MKALQTIVLAEGFYLLEAPRRITHRVERPGRQAVACALGGPDGRTLFCRTVAREFEDVTGCAPTARVEIAKVAIPAQGIWDA